MKIKLYIFLLISIFSFYSCDILRSSLFEVVSWTPGNGYHSEPEKIVISITFSHEPNRASVERSFSITGNGNSVRGNFLWSEKKLTFSPLTYLEKNTDFIISITTDAHNNDGLNMDFSFNGFFTTRAGNTRPVLISYYPQLYAEVDDPKTEVRFEFSLPLSLDTLYDNISFRPSITGLWRLENDDKLAIFTPAESWTFNTRYEVRISNSLEDKNGMNIPNEFIGIFTIGTDREPPHLIVARRVTKDGRSILLSPDKGYLGAAQMPVENSWWEKDDKLLLIFSKPVDSLTVRNNLNIQGGPPILMETNPAFNTEIIFRFDNPPVFESRFTFNIRSGIKDKLGNTSEEEYLYRIFANGIYSKPPVFAGIRMPMAPEEIDPQLISFGSDSLFQIIPITDNYYPSGESKRTWIELYFITTENASVDIFSVIDTFRIDTSNNVISFSPRQVKNSDFTILDPPIGWEDFYRIEITGNLTNSINFGIINFLISSGLKDSLGNRNENQQRISVIK